MKEIKRVIEHMDNTLKEAEEYYHDYIIYKDENTKLANTSLEMAKNHLELYMKWHSVVASLISEYRDKNGEVPESMKVIWNYEHEKLTDEYNKLKYNIMNI